MSVLSKLPKPKLPDVSKVSRAEKKIEKLQNKLDKADAKLQKVETKVSSDVSTVADKAQYDLNQFAADIRAYQKGNLKLEDFFAKIHQ